MQNKNTGQQCCHWMFDEYENSVNKMLRCSHTCESFSSALSAATIKTPNEGIPNFPIICHAYHFFPLKFHYWFVWPCGGSKTTCKPNTDTLSFHKVTNMLAKQLRHRTFGLIRSHVSGQLNQNSNSAVHKTMLKKVLKSWVTILCEFITTSNTFYIYTLCEPLNI